MQETNTQLDKKPASDFLPIMAKTANSLPIYFFNVFVEQISLTVVLLVTQLMSLCV